MILQEIFENGFTTKVINQFKNKSGAVFEVGSTVQCEFNDSFVRVNYNDNSVKIPYKVAFKYLKGFKSPPNMNKLERMSYDGIATTPLGSRTEPDGHGIHGEPSWLLAFGLI